MAAMSYTNLIPEEKVSLSDKDDDGDDDESFDGMKNNSNKNIVVTLINRHPNLQGFGLDISGGIDRPYLAEDHGIFVSAVKVNGLAEKSGKLEEGDKILEVNGHNVLGITHEEAVKLFISDRNTVTLKILKNYGLLLRAASLTPSTTSSTGQVTPTNVSPRKDKKEYNNTLSISGFVIGVAIGCVGVVLLKRYMTSPKI